MSLPVVFLDRLKALYPDNADEIITAYGSERIGSMRVNTLKNTNSKRLPKDIEAEFAEKNIIVSKFDEIDNVYLFDKKYQYDIKGTKAFYEGKIYLQSLSSLLPVLALDPQPYDKILDVCAAPGSKTTQIAALTKNKGVITALEKNKIRCDKLEHNINLQGAKNITTVKTDALKYLSAKQTPMFDAILLDAPCSSEGRFNANNEKSFGFWNLDIVEKNADIQYMLIIKALKKLKKGGTLVYSTCTLSPEENEKVIQSIIEENHKIDIEEISLFQSPYIKNGILEWNGEKFFRRLEKTVRIIPSSETEGFFIAKLRKK